MTHFCHIIFLEGTFVILMSFTAFPYNISYFKQNYIKVVNINLGNPKYFFFEKGIIG